MTKNHKNEGETSALGSPMFHDIFSRLIGFNTSSEISSGHERVDALVKF